VRKMKGNVKCLFYPLVLLFSHASTSSMPGWLADSRPERVFILKKSPRRDLPQRAFVFYAKKRNKFLEMQLLDTQITKCDFLRWA
jgi:hypothetical protein